MQDYGLHILKQKQATMSQCLSLFCLFDCLFVCFYQTLQPKCNNSPHLKTATPRQENAQKYRRERKSGGEREEKVFTAVVKQCFLLIAVSGCTSSSFHLMSENMAALNRAELRQKIRNVNWTHTMLRINGAINK